MKVMEWLDPCIAESCGLDHKPLDIQWFMVRLGQFTRVISANLLLSQYWPTPNCNRAI